MICYASRTGTRLNLRTLDIYNWGLMVSRAGRWRTEGFKNIVGDNGAWSDYQAQREFDEDAYDRFLEWIEPHRPRWLVLPDIVAAGHRSLALSIRYMNRCAAAAPLVLIAVQDGMEDHDLAPLVGPQVGIFLGGSTEWKLRTAIPWGRFCRARGCYFHFARANSIKRISLAVAAAVGIDEDKCSFDGSSGSRYSVNIPMLSYAARQLDMGID